MNSWDLKTLDLKARLPEILSSTADARVIALDQREGESLPELECTSGRGSWCSTVRSR